MIGSKCRAVAITDGSKENGEKGRENQLRDRERERELGLKGR